MNFRDLRALPDEHPLLQNWRWLRWENFVLAVSVSCIGSAMSFEGPGNFEGPVWVGVTTLLPIQAWGYLLLAIGVSAGLCSALGRLPLAIAVVTAVVGSALATLLLLGGQSPASSSVPGLLAFMMVAWTAIIVARSIDMRDDLRTVSRRADRLRREQELDEQERAAGLARESSNDS